MTSTHYISAQLPELAGKHRTDSQLTHGEICLAAWSKGHAGWFVSWIG
jgi:hypothetical protein